MMDLISILTDTELGGTTFFVDRKTYQREQGEVVLSAIEHFSAAGNIQPATSEDLALFPEEERSEEMIIILSPFRFQLGEEGEIIFNSADIVTWRNESYRVIRVKDWEHQGGFHKAWAIRENKKKIIDVN